MKSFDIKFDTNGNVVIDNIKGVTGTECLDLTGVYVKELQDPNSPAETIFHEEQQVFTDDGIISELN